MLPSRPTARLTYTIGITLFFLLGGTVHWQTQRATSSPPPPEVGASGFFLQAASAEQIRALATGLKGGRTVEAAYAIESTRHPQAWYVGGRIQGPGREETLAVWLITGPRDHPALLYSADSVAREISAWPEGKKRSPTSAVVRETVVLTNVLRYQSSGN